MPKGDNQLGKKRGPYKKLPEDVEIRLHPLPKEKPPRLDMRKSLIPKDDPDLNPSKYQKKPKKTTEESEKEEDQKTQEKISRILQNYLKKKNNF